MGAFSLLTALPLNPARFVCGMVADSVYDNVRELLIYQFGRKYPLPKFPTVPVVSLLGRILLGKDFSGLYASGTASECGVPILLIHGTRDHTVPTDMPGRSAGGTGIRSVSVPDGRHAMLWLKEPELYERELEHFINGEGTCH